LQKTEFFISQEFKEEIKKEIRKVVKNFVDETIKTEVMYRVSQIDVPDILRKKLDHHLENNFREIMVGALKLSEKEISKRIQKRVKELVNLKTSTICEIRQEVAKTEIKQDVDYEKQLEIESKNFKGDKRYLEWFNEIK